MNVQPLIIRELRAESRRANTYWVRALAAAALTALFVWAAWTYRGNPNALGAHLFQGLSLGFMLAVLIIVSALTADAISREKREGTLGLLFLTPLTPRDIVIGKCLVHVLRAIPIILAAAPVVGLPFLLGGVSSRALIGAAVGAMHVTLLAVAAGMIASVRNTAWIQSIVWAQIFAFTFLAIKIAVELLTVRGGPAPSMAAGLVLSSAFVVSVFLAALFYAGKRIKTAWQAESVAGEEPLWVRMFSTSDFWRAAFHWDARKARDQNPIAWLQEYNWTSRLTKWGWCILLFGAQVRMLFHVRRYIDYQLNLYILVALGIAFSAAASFRNERQTGALELLLVTPISASKLIWGRLQGIWFHFLPPIAILATVWIMGPQWISLPHRYLFYLAGAYLCIPPIGFYVSLLTPNVLVGWLLTILFGLFLPYALVQSFGDGVSRSEAPAVFLSIQAFLATGAAYLLHENLAKRRFVLSA